LGAYEDATKNNIVPKPKNRGSVFKATPSRRNWPGMKRVKGFRGINPSIRCATKAKDGGKFGSATCCLQ
jgi:hypothetical protein